MTPWLVERRPYDECPHCGRFKFRPLYDGRTEESYGRCKNCEYRDDSVTAEPDMYLDDAGKSEANFMIVVFFLAALAILGWALVQGVQVIV